MTGERHHPRLNIVTRHASARDFGLSPHEGRGTRLGHVKVVVVVAESVPGATRVERIAEALFGFGVVERVLEVRVPRQVEGIAPQSGRDAAHLLRVLLPIVQVINETWGVVPLP
jgi:hypothetical protein